MSKPDLPPGFDSWPLDKRADYLAFKFGREETLRRFRERIGVDPDERTDRVTKTEIARLLALYFESE